MTMMKTKVKKRDRRNKVMKRRRKNTDLAYTLNTKITVKSSIKCSTVSFNLQPMTLKLQPLLTSSLPSLPKAK